MSANPIISGVICEYNPFHYGHNALIEQTRRNGATHVVAVLGGNFVQRGEPACFEKGVRAQAALACGIDLVLELPLPWAMARAETFAFGGVFLLHQLGCVDRLVFGSEHGEISALSALADTLLSPNFFQSLSSFQKAGKPFAYARQKAIEKLCGAEIASLLEHPNNILGIEYCKALRCLQSSIQPETTPRLGAGYHDVTSSHSYPSATQLRHLLKENLHLDFSSYMPQAAAELFRKECESGRIASLQRLETAILSHLRSLTPKDLAQLPDVSEGLENRLWHGIRQAISLDELYAYTKSKRYSHARIRRIVLSSFLGITAQDTQAPPPYLRVLGMNPRGMEILHLAKQTAKLPIVTKYAAIQSQSNWAKHLFSLECRGMDLFTLSFLRPQGCGLEQSRGIIVTNQC